MKAKDVEVGTKVGWAATSNSSYCKHTGTVIGTKLSDGDEVVAIEWSDGSITKANVNDLKVVDTALEKDFEKIRSLVLSAASALREANELARNHNSDLYSLRYSSDDIEIDNLFGALESAGWSTSSMSC